MTTMDALRQRILEIDEKILTLVQERVATAKEIGALKDASDEPLQNFAVEKKVLEHALTFARGQDLDEETTRRLVGALIRAALHAQERARVRRRDGGGRRVLIVGGAGLMGGWFARFFHEKGYTVHVQDPKPSSWPEGSLDAAEYDIVVLATPPSTLPDLLSGIGRKLPKDALVFDIASIKGQAKTVLRRLAAEGRQVASLHPMFGPSTELLMDHNILVLDCGDAKAAKATRELFSDTTARVTTLPLEDHDAIMADVLGLAHAVSLVFNRALAKGPQPLSRLSALASTTLRKQVEVSREVAKENPGLYFEIQTLNPRNEAMLDRLAEALEHLRSLVRNHDAAGFEGMMAEGRRYYEEGTPK